MAPRREARERALELCYELEARGVDADVDGLLAALSAPPDPYAERLVRGVDAHREEIDALLRKHSEHWAVERMPAVDRALLRIGGYELGWEPELSTAIVIDEAVELADRYSTRDSSRFVNALLSRVGEELRRVMPLLAAPMAPTEAPVEAPIEEPIEIGDPGTDDVVVTDRPWIVIVWNDPVNLMSYVVYVFQKLFGYSREKATRLMHQVHYEGKAAVSEGTREKAEADVARLHAHGLWATMERPG